ncbi:MAG: hypothetical protein HW391_1722 [Chloroflexi bacterium]|nr:hypothetical protein [Chloroflexota bacterium]
MTGLAILGLIIASFAILGLAAARWGVDSRIGFENGHGRTGFLV